MKAPQAPRLDQRRRKDFSAELRERAQAWIPEWALTDGERDFGRALLEVAARFSSEVAERLDYAGNRMRGGLLDWLAIPRKAALPSRLPVVFKLVDAATEAVLASAPVRMQADAAGQPVVFETEQDVRVVPGHVQVVVGVDAPNDKFFVSPPGLSDLQPLASPATQWSVKNYTAAGSIKLQLDPDTGLEKDMIVEAAGRQYQVTNFENDIVTIEPALASELPQSTIVRKVTAFAPFDDAAINWQEHALYLGHMELLDIEAAATLNIVGAELLGSGAGVIWQYWGKNAESGNEGDESDWQALQFADVLQAGVTDAVVLHKTKGAIEPYEVNGRKSRWIRAYSKQIADPTGWPFITDQLSIGVNASGCTGTPTCPPTPTTGSPVAEATANTTPLVLDSAFYPLGKEPRQGDSFYLGSKEVFSKPSATVDLCFEMALPSFKALSCLRAGQQPVKTLAGVSDDGYLYLFQFDSTSGSLSPYPNREQLRPPTPASGGKEVAVPPIALDPYDDSPYRVPIWTRGTIICVAASADNAVWIWNEDTKNPANSGWESAGLINPSSGSGKSITGLRSYLAHGIAGSSMHIHDSKLIVHDLGKSAKVLATRRQVSRRR